MVRMIVVCIILLGYIAVFISSVSINLNALYFLIFLIPITILWFYDSRSHHNILRNYPVIGHLRYAFEFIRPEIQQYFVATNHSGRPYNREMRSLVYQRAKNAVETHPFGTELDVTKKGYISVDHSLNCHPLHHLELIHTFGGPDCKKRLQTSLLNISAMSFGSLSPTAIEALNNGARIAKMYHNTGEGGISPYHLNGNGNLVWQIGTGYFGCRDQYGGFSIELFRKRANHHNVKMIEIKLSQGAKPGHGGILPKEKITTEIAEIRGIPMDRDCISPPGHSAFSGPLGLCTFIQQLRKTTNGKPIGIKLCIGVKSEFMSLCKAMIESGITPDFITVDGSEGGTGAAPLIFSNRVGTPGNEALHFVNNCLIGCGLRDKISLIASGKVTTSFEIACKLALGANTINMARPFMFSLGCIQAMRCNLNNCPTGVTSNNPWRYKAIVVDEKAQRVANFHKNTLKSLSELMGAMGCHDPKDIKAELFKVRVNEAESISLKELYPIISTGCLLNKKTVPDCFKPWLSCSSKQW